MHGVCPLFLAGLWLSPSICDACKIGSSANSVQITHDADHVHLQIRCPLFPKPRAYTYSQDQSLRTFFKDLQNDAGATDLPVELQWNEAVVSDLVQQKFAWCSGRTLQVGEYACPVEEHRTSTTTRPVIPGSSQDAVGTNGKNMKYVVVSGGVVSGLGKGVTCSSLGALLKAAGFRVTAIKIDPYLNTDAGTMSPYEHGECFVLDDGGEVDLDLGNYERFLQITLKKDNNLTAGKVYQAIVSKERKGDYLGKTVQVVPHVTNIIQDWLERVAHVPVDNSEKPPDICLVELGGTVGDIESMPFVEALRQFQFRVGRENICFFHVSLVPVLGVVGEAKTKPSQHTVRELRAAGLAPDFLVCRSSQPLPQDTKSKLSNFCHVPAEHCIGVHDVSNIYRVPLLLHDQSVMPNLMARLGLHSSVLHKGLRIWVELADLVDSLTTPISIAIVGKYTGLSDAYLSVTKALQHASYAVGLKLQVKWIESTALEPEEAQRSPSSYQEAWETLRAAQGVLVPGGFGDRGIEGKVLAAQFAREHQKPFLGICLGMQAAVIEFSRHVLKLDKAHSAEFEETDQPVVVFMPEVSRTEMGGTMRLGSRPTVLQTKSASSRLYKGVSLIHERFRHRYEVNPKYVQQLEQEGMKFVGQDSSAKRMSILELEGHPFYVGCQFHPEYKSRPGSPSPLFLGLLQAASASL